ncbi:ASCH domain-containing protein [bacterium 19MO03SA05]|uniref:ASCH domain-containing protein n=1 Tax=bacterium 19MO03SA05 TaxID=2920620 RepID=A0AAU6VLM3_UNCXX
MKKRILHLPVKAVYFHQIKNGGKPFEFRLQTEYWRKRIENRDYDEVHIKMGYPKKGDLEKIVVRPWRGYEKQTITHEHFNNEPVEVFAIIVN